MKDEIVEELARAMAASQGHDWDGKAKGTKYANHGYWIGSAKAIAPIIDRLVSEALEEGVRIGATLAADYAIQKLKGPDHA